MEYSEKSDFEEKLSALAAMNERLVRHGMARDFSAAHTLEIGGAGGVFGGLISSTVGRIIVSDVIDAQAAYGGEFVRLLKEKFVRNGYDFRLEKIEFHVSDAMYLPYKNDLFDFVVSINAFEHITEPTLALQEAVRVVKKGGVIYLTFDPIWTADSGSHFINFVTEPWKHLLCSTDDFCGQMKNGGATDGEINDFRYTLNRKSASIYKNEFPKLLSLLGVEKFELENWSGCVQEAYSNHPNRFEAAKILGCPPDDLLIRGFAVCIVK